MMILPYYAVAAWPVAHAMIASGVASAPPCIGGDGRRLGVGLSELRGTMTYAFVLVDLALIACYAYLAVLSARQLLRVT